MYQYDPAGTFKSMTGLPCKKIEVESQSELDHLTIAIPYKQRFESDFTPIDRILMDVYSKQNVPTLNIGFFDIEVDYDPAIGFSSVKNPYAPINAPIVPKKMIQKILRSLSGSIATYTAGGITISEGTGRIELSAAIRAVILK
jgi:hypothetical protein